MEELNKELLIRQKQILGTKEETYITEKEVDKLAFKQKVQETVSSSQGLKMVENKPYPDLKTYTGTIDSQDMKVGFGKLVNEGTASVYIGQFDQDKANGKGRQVFPNEDIYQGEWENNLMHGFGIYTQPDGTKYTGHFESDQKSGDAVEICADGSKYSGMFIKGKRHG